ncbi:MAG: tetratricopeptide repeat protein, partial [Cyanobacteriota bacterium]
MPTNRVSRTLAGLLSAPMVLFTAMPGAALSHGHTPNPQAASPMMAQVPASGDQSIPPEITALEERVRSLHERGEPQRALEEMERVMAWVNANLPKTHPYRARSQAWIGLLLSAVGRRQEALAPTEEALKIYRGL